MTTIQDIKDYYDKLSKAFEKGDWFYVQNQDRAHNAAIMRLMLEKSDVLNMYCGEMSIFRKDFYRHLNEETKGLGDEMRQKVADALIYFLSKPGSKLTIILENQSPTLFEDLIIPMDAFRQTLSAQIHCLSDKIGNRDNLMHFAYTPTKNMLRMEVQKENHEGIFTIGNEDGTSVAAEAFSSLLSMSEQVRI